jgi:hypothetical protein
MRLKWRSGSGHGAAPEKINQLFENTGVIYALAGPARGRHLSTAGLTFFDGNKLKGFP